MRTRIRCPWHNEKTASLVRRKGDWFCYGACHKAYKHEEVEAKVGEKIDYEYEEGDDAREDLHERFDYISSLPKRDIRGLALHSDFGGYFITWPDNQFYKYRKFTGEPKYVGPKGHKPPLFWARRRGTEALYIVEGEINALSAAVVIKDDVCSPGSASCFNPDNLGLHLTQIKQYSKVVVVLDNDKAGRQGLIEARALFLYKIPYAEFMLISPDCNEILSEEGPKALRDRLQGKDS